MSEILPATINPPIDGDDTEAIVESLMPYFPEDSRRGKYLSYRACGFTIREAVSLTGITERTLRRWREADPEFRKMDLEMVTDLRARLGDHYIAHEYRRNMRLVLDKDFEVFKRSVEGEELTDKEQSYLIKARSFYTPQQLQIIREILGESDQKDFDWTEYVMRLRSREGDTVEIAARRE